MNGSNKTEEDTSSQEITDLLEKLNGRVTNEIWVVDGRTGEKCLICSYDFDLRDTAEIVFKAEEIPPDEETGETGKVIYTFCFEQKPGEEVSKEMAGKKQVSQKALDEFGEALRKAVPTCEDYLHNADINFKDLSRFEQCRVLEHDLEVLIETFDSYGYSEEEKKPGMFAKIFGKKTPA